MFIILSLLTVFLPIIEQQYCGIIHVSKSRLADYSVLMITDLLTLLEMLSSSLWLITVLSDFIGCPSCQEYPGAMDLCGFPILC
jgi:hypothetical protein